MPWIQLNGNNLKYRVSAEFYADCSYIKNTDTRLLAHEQLHFDMVELYARKMRQFLQGCNKRRVSTAEITATLGSMDEELHRMQARYDDVTSHGLKWRAQNAWNRQVQASLDSLHIYSTTDGRIELAPGYAN